MCLVKKQGAVASGSQLRGSRTMKSGVRPTRVAGWIDQRRNGQRPVAMGRDSHMQHTCRCLRAQQLRAKQRFVVEARMLCVWKGMALQTREDLKLEWMESVVDAGGPKTCFCMLSLRGEHMIASSHASSPEATALGLLCPQLSPICLPSCGDCAPPMLAHPLG